MVLGVESPQGLNVAGEEGGEPVGKALFLHCRYRTMNGTVSLLQLLNKPPDMGPDSALRPVSLEQKVGQFPSAERPKHPNSLRHILLVAHPPPLRLPFFTHLPA